MNKYIFAMKLKGFHIFLGNWEDEQDIINDFELEPNALNGAFVLLAEYTTGGYEGSAFVLFERDGQLYEVNGSHCSCMGLEGQWSPEETSDTALVHRIKNGNLGSDYYDGDVFGQKLLSMLEAGA